LIPETQKINARPRMITVIYSTSLTALSPSASLNHIRCNFTCGMSYRMSSFL